MLQQVLCYGKSLEKFRFPTLQLKFYAASSGRFKIRPTIFLTIGRIHRRFFLRQVTGLARYISRKNITEQYSFSELLSIIQRKRGPQSSECFFEKHAFDQKRLVSICSDGVLFRIGYKPGFKGLANNTVFQVLFTHCLKHGFALAMETPPS